MRGAGILLVCLVALGGCKLPARAPAPTAPEGTAAFVAQQRAICERRGGSFGRSPGKVTQVCFITPKDAGKACSQGSDCEGHCLARSRSCAPVTPLFGCNEVLLEGGLAATVCLD
ncbi:MAG: hypothetical protein ACK5JR_16330 [Tropicimonas sp.]|uniref:hypothetical protein n=1 Tax=Tropicimonas sp. TaxID=2067044 RepID=UPI003A83F703